MYTFKINIGSYTSPVIGGGYITCNPLADGVKFVKYREENYYKVVRNKIEGELTFYDIPGGNQQYTALKSLMDNDNIYVNIQVYFDDVLKLSGRLDLLGKWDTNKHTCELTIKTDDQYTEILGKLDTEIDFLNVSSVTANARATSMNDHVVSSETQLPQEDYKAILFGDDADLWILESTQVIPGSPIMYIYTWTSSYLYFEATGYRYSTYDRLCHKPISTTETIVDPFTRFRLMKSVLDYIFTYLGISVVADTDYCSYFDVDTEMKYLMIADKSDVKRHDSSESASFEFIKIGDFFEIYKLVSNLDWYIEDGKFYLEYPNEYELADLETYPDHDFLGKGYYFNIQKFEFDGNKKLKKETWEFEEAGHFDFRKQTIEYDNFETNRKEYSRTDINTDFEQVTLGQGDVSDSGIVVVATSYSGGYYYIINKNGLIQARSFINGKLALTNIINDHMIPANRPYASGEFLGNTESLGIGNNKIIEYTNVPIYDADLINFNYCINTELGWAFPDKLEIDLTLKKASTFTGRLIPSLISTIAASSITDDSAVSGGIIKQGITVVSRGLCYAEHRTPDLTDSFTVQGSGTGTFNDTVTGFDPETTYYVRAYATTLTTTIYGNEISLITLAEPSFSVDWVSLILSTCNRDGCRTATLNLTVTTFDSLLLRFSIEILGIWASVDETVPGSSTDLAVDMVITSANYILNGYNWKLDSIIDGEVENIFTGLIGEAL